MVAAWQIYHVQQVRTTEHMTKVITFSNCQENTSQDFHAVEKLHKAVLKKYKSIFLIFFVIFFFVFLDVAFVCIAAIHCLIMHVIL